MPSRRASGLLLVVALVAPVAAAEDDAAPAPEGASSALEDYLPSIGLPGSTGNLAAGNGSATAGRIEVTRQAAASATTTDLPTWLMEKLGWKKPAPAGEVAEPKKRHLTAVPFISSSPVSGVGAGLAAAGTSQFGEAKDTSLSKYDLSLTITTESQYAATSRHALRFPGDDWGLTGMWRWTKWPSPTWGIGGNTQDTEKSRLDYQLIRLYELVTRRVVDKFYVGFGYTFDYYFNVSNGPTASGQPSDFSKYAYGTGSSTLNSGPTLALVWDSSDSPVYPTSGVVADLNYSFFPGGLGSSTTWQTVYLDLRTYRQLAPFMVLAFWTYGSFTFGETPYLELASNGSDPNERSGRGYIQGRHMSKSMLYGEAELRFNIWQWLGAVAGFNIHSVSERNADGTVPDGLRFKHWYPSVTAGLRLLAVKETRANICLDYGVGIEGQHGFYLSFNEAF
ncbi:MAG TPA: hypothetical protein VFE90_10125 [Myxococcales bacterium]|nr:hypothetical protein [Myxococcales bacterium]